MSVFTYCHSGFKYIIKYKGALVDNQAGNCRWFTLHNVVSVGIEEAADNECWWEDATGERHNANKILDQMIGGMAYDVRIF